MKRKTPQCGWGWEGPLGVGPGNTWQRGLHTCARQFHQWLWCQREAAGVWDTKVTSTATGLTGLHPSVTEVPALGARVVSACPAHGALAMLGISIFLKKISQENYKPAKRQFSKMQAPPSPSHWLHPHAGFCPRAQKRVLAL